MERAGRPGEPRAREQVAWGRRWPEFIRTRGRGSALLALNVVLFALFVRLRALSAVVGMPIHYAYPVAVDRWLTFGHEPISWLQHHLLPASGLGAADFLLVAVYVTYFVAPPVMAILLWWRRSPRLGPFTLAVFGVLYLGLVVNLLVPTAPPWMAAALGYIPAIHRGVPEVLDFFVHGLFSTGDRMAGANDVAAMPSLHMAVATVVAVFLPRPRRLPFLPAVLYAGLMGLALMTLGEHFLVDVLAGLALALAVCAVVLHPPLHRHRAAG
ncbi:MAG TPA: phosphatase PAP2 family protein [Thermomicrobiaceae bacterium]|nr:phosphatase PAP2 family protein [Thermomicrobiaceae bacterium]